MKRLLVKIAAGFALFCGVVLLALLPVSYPSGGIAFAQVNNPVIIIVGSTPSACNTLPLQIVAGTASLYGTNGSGGCTQISGPGSGAVTSVFGRTGAVTANTGDYTAAKVTNALDLSASGTQTMVGSLSIAVGQSIDVPIHAKSSRACCRNAAGWPMDLRRIECPIYAHLYLDRLTHRHRGLGNHNLANGADAAHRNHDNNLEHGWHLFRYQRTVRFCRQHLRLSVQRHIESIPERWRYP